jgi:hypothetical protein
MQAAGRASDSALRLKLMMDHDVSHTGEAAAGGDGSKEDLQGGDLAKDYQRATTGFLKPPFTCEMLERALAQADPGWLLEEAHAFLNWWRRSMAGWDPNSVGSIREREFAEAYRGYWNEICERLRVRHRACAVSYFHAHAGRVDVGSVRSWVGGGSDVPGLSCLTERAAGWARRRWMHVLAPESSLLDAVVAELRPRLGADGSLMKSIAETDGWGGLVLVLDEIDVTILGPNDPRVEGITERGSEHRDVASEWRVMEGCRPSPQTNWKRDTAA